MKKLLLLLALSGGVLTAMAQECSDIFFSEYVEGSGNNKALEIYNPTDNIIDLSKYTVIRYSNGGTSPSSGYMTQLVGFLQPASTFVLVNGQTADIDLGGSTSPKCDPALQALADQLDGDYPAPTYMNGNDAIALIKDDNGTDVAVDLFGTIGGNMTSSDEGWTDFTDAWAYRNIYDADGNPTGKDSTFITDYIVPQDYFWLPWTANHTLIRKASVKEGIKADPGVFVVTMEWDTLTGGADIWTNLGMHDCACQSNSFRNIDLNNNLSLYPNPTESGYFTLEAIKDFNEIEVFNTEGKRMNTLRLGQGIRQKNISVSDLKAGLYIIKVYYSDGKSDEMKFQKIN
jgi:hypothetical protein